LIEAHRAAMNEWLDSETPLDEAMIKNRNGPRRHGKARIRELEAANSRAARESKQADRALATCKPSTVGGEAALTAYAVDSMSIMFVDANRPWGMAALRNAAAALQA
jgi:hypothetical protein